jgi:hypothetical protein
LALRLVQGVGEMTLTLLIGIHQEDEVVSWRAHLRKRDTWNPPLGTVLRCPANTSVCTSIRFKSCLLIRTQLNPSHHS